MIGGALGSYIFSVVGVVVIAAVADLLMPEGKTAKYIKNALSVFLVFVIISPAANLFSDGVNIDNIFNTQTGYNDYGFINSLNTQKARALENSTQNHLEQQGYEGINVKLLYSGDDKGINIDFVQLDLTNFEFNGGNEHIHIIDKIIDLTAGYLNVNRERVFVYGENQ